MNVNPGNVSYDVLLQNLLADHVEALLGGVPDRNTLLARYGLVRDPWANALLTLAEDIQAALRPVNPSNAFVAALYNRLVGLPELTLLERLMLLRLAGLRHMPRRMQWAAGIGGLTLTAGVFWIAARGRLASAQRVPKTTPDGMLAGVAASERTA
jgi:hypothetical protein